MSMLALGGSLLLLSSDERLKQIIFGGKLAQAEAPEISTRLDPKILRGGNPHKISLIEIFDS
jgi:hypothetical protein